MVDIRSHDPRSLRFCDYVERSWPEVVTWLSSPSIDSVLSEALGGVLDGAEVAVRASVPELVVGGTARIQLRWHADWSTGSVEGTATIIVLPVQTGCHAVTELLVDVAIPGERTAAATDAAHQFLQVLVDRITHG